MLLSLLNKYHKPEVESIVVRILVQIPRPINYRDLLEDIKVHMRSCLHHHNRNTAVQTLRALLDYGPDINCRDGSGKTPLRDLLSLNPNSMPSLLAYRQTLALYIFENPDPDLHKTVFMQVTGIDRKLQDHDFFGNRGGSLGLLRDFSELGQHIIADGKLPCTRFFHTMMKHTSDWCSKRHCWLSAVFQCQGLPMDSYNICGKPYIRQSLNTYRTIWIAPDHWNSDVVMFLGKCTMEEIFIILSRTQMCQPVWKTLSCWNVYWNTHQKIF